MIPAVELLPHGVGHEVKKLIEEEGLIPAWLRPKSCRCQELAAKLDEWGPDTCERNRAYIEDQLIRNASESFLLRFAPGKQAGAKWILDEAISRARHNAWDGGSQGDWVCAITTAPRPAPTLGRCINSMRVAGWEPVVFAEPGSPQTNCHTVWNARRRGCYHNWLHSVKWVLENTDAKNILTVQDDSFFHPDSRKLVESIMWPSKQPGFISLYTNAKYGRGRQPGIFKIHTRVLWGTLALAWPREVLERVVKLPLIKEWHGLAPKSRNPAVMRRRRADPSLVNNSDVAIGRACFAMRRDMFFIKPSPVQHIAKHSTISHGGNSGNRNCQGCADHSLPLMEQVYDA